MIGSPGPLNEVFKTTEHPVETLELDENLVKATVLLAHRLDTGRTVDVGDRR